jgi:hypothetical protein
MVASKGGRVLRRDGNIGARFRAPPILPNVSKAWHDSGARSSTCTRFSGRIRTKKLRRPGRRSAVAGSRFRVCRGPRPCALRLNRTMWNASVRRTVRIAAGNVCVRSCGVGHHGVHRGVPYDDSTRHAPDRAYPESGRRMIRLTTIQMAWRRSLSRAGVRVRLDGGTRE